MVTFRGITANSILHSSAQHKQLLQHTLQPTTGRSLAEIAGSNPAEEAWLSVSCEWCVLSGRGLCDGLITRPEESYRVGCECYLETS